MSKTAVWWLKAAREHAIKAGASIDAASYYSSLVAHSVDRVLEALRPCQSYGYGLQSELERLGLVVVEDGRVRPIKPEAWK